jgi:opacity protein-like surface antigen
VDPATTVFDVREYASFENATVQEFFVRPQDRFGRYMGPGREGVVDFQVHTGTQISEVLDYDNGYYSVLVRQDEGDPMPDVTVDVQGTPIEPQRGGIPGAELGFYADGYGFDDTLNLDTGLGVGGWIGVPLWNSPLYAEGEFGVTRTNITATDTVRVMQGLANLRYDVQLGGRLVPHVTAGTGFVRFFGEGDDETVLALQAGAGLSWFFTPHVGLRANGRLFRINEVRGAGGATTNLQGYLGLVLRR